MSQVSANASHEASEHKDVKLEAKDTKFRPAKSIDFQEGKILYVRGRKGTCRRFEYPLVHWVFSDEDVEKHRSFLINADMFTVPREEDLGQSTGESAASGKSSKVFIHKKKGEELKLDAKTPQSLQIEACEDCTLVLSEPVLSLTLVNCTNIKTTFVSVASRCELIKSGGCTFVCQSSCGTYFLEDSIGTKIIFPKNSPGSVQWLTVKALKTVLEAHDSEGSKTLSHDIEKAAIEKEIADSALVRLRTTYIKGTFSTDVHKETNGLVQSS